MAALMRFLSWIGPLAGIGAMALGLLHWFLHISFLELHILFGSVVTLALLASGVVALFTRGLRAMGVLALVCAFIVPAFGMAQMQLLVGELHWLVRVAHLLVGAAAVGLTERICGRYAQLRQRRGADEPAAQAS